MDPVPEARSGPAWTGWLAGQQPDPRATARLVCLPYAGGGAAIYRRWQRMAPPGIQVCPVELPGRGQRLAEPAYRRMASLVRALVAVVDPLRDRPLAVFGHSMGGLVAYELVRALCGAGGPVPVHLFVSATAAPGTPPLRPLLHCAPDGDVKRQLRALNGTPRELLEDEQIMALMLPVVRADFAVLETYEHRERPPLPVPLTVFGGADDTFVPPSALAGWRRHSDRGARVRLFPGGHFFLHGAAEDLVGEIARALRPWPAGQRTGLEGRERDGEA